MINKLKKINRSKTIDLSIYGVKNWAIAMLYANKKFYSIYDGKLCLIRNKGVLRDLKQYIKGM